MKRCQSQENLRDSKSEAMKTKTAITFVVVAIGVAITLCSVGAFVIDARVAGAKTPDLQGEGDGENKSHQAPDGDDRATAERLEIQYNGFPKTAFEYAKMVEPILGMPPKVDLGEGVEIPLYVDGVQKRGNLGYSCDNPSQLSKGCVSGSVLQRHEGRNADGEPLPEVVWVSFGRNASYTRNGKVHVFGSVQLIGYHKETGATAFFESSDAIDPWASIDPETKRLLGVMPWVDKPGEFNRAYKSPRGLPQCVQCHQNDPFITNSFINAAKIPGTNESVVPFLDRDAPYYVIGGENWDMRTIHIEDNGCFECHRVGMGTLVLFTRNGWNPNEHMPPHDPGSLADDLQELLAAWKRGPENVPGAEWVVPPARGEDQKVVAGDYPYQAGFNTPGNEASGGAGIVKAFGGSGPVKAPWEKTREEHIESMKAKGITDEQEIAKWLKHFGAKGESKRLD